jgi:type II secretory pathway pseudopilin PulG
MTVIPPQSSSGHSVQRPLPASKPRAEAGYILLILLLAVALLAIAAAAIVPTIAFQIKRDREEELVHRGVQYSRAVRRYYKKFGQYPARIEDLLSSNNMHFLRKRYKDPITGQDFKLLHVGDVTLSLGTGIAGAATPGSMTGNPSAAAGAGFGPLSGASSAPGGGAAPGAAPSDPGSAGTDAANSADSGTGTDASQPGGPSPAPGQSGATGPGSGSAAGSDKLAGQTFGGGAIVGVTSTSKLQSIREYNKKDHYNQWQFIYDPGADHGGLITTPTQPMLQSVPAVGQPGAGQSGGATPGNATGLPAGPGGLSNPSGPGGAPQPTQPQP